MKIPKQLYDYVLFCMIDTSSDGWQDIGGLILREDFKYLNEWKKLFVVYDDSLQIILICDKYEVEQVLKEYPKTKSMQASKFVKKYREEIRSRA